MINYIEYNNFTVVRSEIYSVFDFLKTHKRVSEYDSENLMYALIDEVLSENSLSMLGVICHQLLHMLIRDTGRLNDEERRFAMNSAAHIDFLIYNRIGKKPVLCIEVDGFHFHKKGTAQSERDKKKDRILDLYGIQLLRFATNCSVEKEKLTAKLKEVLK